MIFYKAKKYNSQVYLKDSDQMDRYLERGCDIYMEEDGLDTLIATPKDGYLIKRPVFPEKIVIKN